MTCMIFKGHRETRAGKFLRLALEAGSDGLPIHAFTNGPKVDRRGNYTAMRKLVNNGFAYWGQNGPRGGKTLHYLHR